MTLEARRELLSIIFRYSCMQRHSIEGYLIYRKNTSDVEC